MSRRHEKEMKQTKFSRRKFLTAVIASGGLTKDGVNNLARASDFARDTPAATTDPTPSAQSRSAADLIDRAALIKRHNPVLRKLDPLSPLSLGNGEFAFTGDVTGLQTFPSEYEKAMPLCTMSQWGWHTAPPSRGFDPSALRLTNYDTHGRLVSYPTGAEGQGELYNWLRENPHRLHLGQIGLRLLTDGHGEARIADIDDIEQRLDLWTGTLISRFVFDGQVVTVTTAVHPDLDLLAATIESGLIGQKRLAVRFAFPYGSPGMAAADWEQPGKHQSMLVGRTNAGALIRRTLDADRYFVAINWDGEASLQTEAEHAFLLTPGEQNSRLEFVAWFSPRPVSAPPPKAAATLAASAARWKRFWTRGAAVELSESRDRRAPELERRVVLSQYLTAVQCAGSLPPQETGLTVNSWYGKFHLEMHWWHAAHFALWNRLPLLEKSLGWYDSVRPSARAWAVKQGYAGVRWPKMTDPNGRDSPSAIGPLLIWQQPHPIFMAELCYLTRPDRNTLTRYRQIVFQTAEFMASYAFFDPQTRRYVLGPPVIPAQENHPPRETWNPTFELAYWAYGLKLAQAWRERLGMSRSPAWDRVISTLAPLPVRDGVYLAQENCPQTFTERNFDHPSMLGALGMLPHDASVDRETMRRTLHKVMKEWRWEDTWGWDYPLTAMTAARLGEPEIAIDALLMPTAKNGYSANGHNWQRPNLPCYLPGNGGLLYAIALMAGGWRGAPPQSRAPGFPSDGSWTVRAENFAPSLFRNL